MITLRSVKKGNLRTKHGGSNGKGIALNRYWSILVWLAAVYGVIVVHAQFLWFRLMSFYSTSPHVKVDEIALDGALKMFLRPDEMILSRSGFVWEQGVHVSLILTLYGISCILWEHPNLKMKRIPAGLLAVGLVSLIVWLARNFAERAVVEGAWRLGLILVLTMTGIALGRLFRSRLWEAHSDASTAS